MIQHPVKHPRRALAIQRFATAFARQQIRHLPCPRSQAGGCDRVLGTRRRAGGVTE
jgi:hypothetical protein